MIFLPGKRMAGRRCIPGFASIARSQAILRPDRADPPQLAPRPRWLAGRARLQGYQPAGSPLRPGGCIYFFLPVVSAELLQKIVGAALMLAQAQIVEYSHQAPITR
jgi:hypothetical protein